MPVKRRSEVVSSTAESLGTYNNNVNEDVVTSHSILKKRPETGYL